MNTIAMVEGDYGIEYRLNIINGTPSQQDSFSIIIKDKSGNTKISKDYTNVSTHIPFTLTESESKELTAGEYYYLVDWYQNNVFMKNLLNYAPFIVKRKG